MRRLGLLACALVASVLLGTGCLSDADKKALREARREWNGENIQMGSYKTKDP